MDAAIVGAGVGGLWLANLLVNRGLAVAVCDGAPVGGVQTIASQGVIHGGLKYGFAHTPTALTEMPARWRRCLAGDGEIDLSQVPTTAERMHLFSAASDARVRALVAGHLLAGRAERLNASATPPFDHAKRGVLLALEDFVVDVPALVRALAAPLRGRIIHHAVTADALVHCHNRLRRIEVPGYDIDANVYLFAAGTGNARLLRAAGFADVTPVRRPLRQTTVWLDEPARLFAHCLTKMVGAEPEMTITSHGRSLYIGGKVASEGVRRDHHSQVAMVRRLLGELFPNIDLTSAKFATCLVDRAEPRAGGIRPSSDAFALRRGNCVLCWPLKLSLAPRLGDLVLGLLEDLAPRGGRAWPGEAGPDPCFATPPYANGAATC